MSLHLNEYWLEFDGVDDYVEARNATDLDFALPIKAALEFTSKSGDYQIVLGKTMLGPGAQRYELRLAPPQSEFQFLTRKESSDPTYINGYAISNIDNNTRYEVEILDDSGDRVMKVNGNEVSRLTTWEGPNPNTDWTFQLGHAYSGQTQWHFHGKIYSFQIGTETFPLNEGTGTTITGSEGTVLDIYGATWGGSPNKQINEVYIEDSGVLRPVKNIYLGTSTGLKNIYQSEPTP